MRARFVRVAELIESMGLQSVREPHVKHIRGPLWEMRLKGKAGIARALYVTSRDQRVVVLRVFAKNSRTRVNGHSRRDRPSARAGEGAELMATVKELHRRWSKDPGYRTAYDALDEEFELAKALVEARTEQDCRKRSSRRATRFFST
jgi:phage-related protein